MVRDRLQNSNLTEKALVWQRFSGAGAELFELSPVDFAGTYWRTTASCWNGADVLQPGELDRHP